MRLCFVVCYMGRLPAYFPLWLSTCARNPTVDWLAVTDGAVPCAVPPNVRIVRMTFDEVRARLSALFPFPIALKTPWKLCDYKPAFGEAFADLLAGYDLWGFCDLDVLWGDIRAFFPDEILRGYPRILTRGHCSLFRSDPETNALYRTLPARGCQDWRDVYSSDGVRAFDEWAGHCGGGLSEIFRRNGIPQYDGRIYLGPDARRTHLYLEETPGVYGPEYCVICRDGKLYAAMLRGDQVILREYLYFHFQKRPPVLPPDGPPRGDFAFIPPNRVVPLPGTLTAEQLGRWMTVRGISLQPLNARLAQIRDRLQR